MTEKQQEKLERISLCDLAPGDRFRETKQSSHFLTTGRILSYPGCSIFCAIAWFPGSNGPSVLTKEYLPKKVWRIKP